jgi:hypothetical protein
MRGIWRCFIVGGRLMFENRRRGRTKDGSGGMGRELEKGHFRAVSYFLRMGIVIGEGVGGVHALLKGHIWYQELRHTRLHVQVFKRASLLLLYRSLCQRISKAILNLPYSHIYNTRLNIKHVSIHSKSTNASHQSNTSRPFPPSSPTNSPHIPSTSPPAS